MATRRQEKAAQLIKKQVSDIIANHLNDPRIEGFVSITKVEMAADLRTANVYLSIFPTVATGQSENKTFTAIKHARSRIQSLLGRKLESKFCPVLNFHMDEGFRKSFDTIRLIEQVVSPRDSSRRTRQTDGEQRATDSSD
ncbi:MAG: 30S ribosome-binding factor RbfA [Sedimentisphaerales bacterium]|nr:30S ribosome-binding factor RbfA [Sedimentisphaerales bacterium]